ncbi:MAG: alpha/beta fold hydrolase [Cryomorphaceae bacterium]|nr:MAG: alpha/beta fold hydrolase [Cryomorphaceae bacterium]
MKLNYKKQGSGKPIIILHGLFGMLDNWQSIANQLAENHEVWLVDQRNHGRSPHANEHTYSLMASDLNELITNHTIDNPLLVGHSMGGKTVMWFAQKYPGVARALVVVDMGIREYPIHHDGIIDALHSLKVDKITSRNEADEQLANRISSFGIRQFLLKNLHRKKEGGFEWKFNLPVLETAMENIVEALPDGNVEIPALFIAGGASNYITAADVPEIMAQFTNAEVEVIPDAGHWVHAEKPNEVTKLIEQMATK